MSARFDGKLYLTAREAAEKFGYTSDYVAMLCRRGKVVAKRVEKNWFIQEHSLVAFIESTKLAESVRRAKLREVRQAEYQPLTGTSAYQTSLYSIALMRLFAATIGVSVFAGALFVGAYAFPQSGYQPIARSVHSLAQDFPNNIGRHLAVVAVAIGDTVSGEVRTSTDAELLDFSWMDFLKGLATRFFGGPTPAPQTQVVVATSTTNTRVVERTPTTVVRNVTERVVLTGITEAELNLRLQTLENKLLAELYKYTADAARGISGNYRAIQLMNVIDELNGVTIRNATIIGGSITNVTGIGGSGSGTVNAGTQGQIAFYSDAGSAVSATSTIFISQAQLIGIATSTPLAQLTVYGDILLSGSNRYLNFGESLGNLGYGIRDNAGVLEFKNNAGTWTVFGSSGGGADGNWSFFNNSGIRLTTSTNQVLIGANATTSNSALEVVGSGLFRGLLTAYQTITAPSFTATSTTPSTFINASSSALSSYTAAFGGTATSTFSSAGVLSLAAALNVTSGGTGWGDIQANTVLLGNGTGALATTSAGTNGQVLALVSGVPTWQSTTTLASGTGISTSYSSGAWTISNTGLSTWPWTLTTNFGTTTNATTTPTWYKTGVYASSTSQFTNATTTQQTIANALWLTTLTSGALAVDANGLVYKAATSTLADITGTLSVTKGGTGQASFGQGILAINDSGAFVSTTSPTVAYITATSSATSSFAGGVSALRFGASATSTLAGVDLASGCFAVSGVCIGSSSGLTSIGPAGALQTGPAITLATTSTAFNGLTSSTTITATTNTITFANSLAGLLQVAGGGTGLSTVADGNLLFGSPSGTALTALATSTGGFLSNSYTTGRPSWVATSSLNINFANLIGTATDAQVADNLTISGGVIDNTPIGNSTPSTGIFTNTTSTNATTTNQYVSGQLRVASLSGLLLGSTGVVSAISNGTNGHILAMVNGVPSFVATTTAGTGLTYDGTSFNVNFSGISQSKWATTTTDSLAITPNTALTVGIGTTTPKWALTISSSTKPQLTLTDGSLTSAPFNLRAINSMLYFSTSSPSTFATTTSSFISFDSTTASTSILKLDVTGTATSTHGNGINLASGCFAISGTCLSTSGGVTSISIPGNTLTGAVTFATSSTAFNGLTASTTITNSSGTLTFANTLAGLLQVAGGGTGLSTVADGNLLFGSPSGTALTALATSTGGFLTNSYTTGRPSWVATSSLNINFANLIGTATDAQVADNLTISGGVIDNTPIGNSTPSTGIFTNATSTNATTTNQYVSGQLRVASLSGLLLGSTGVVSAISNGTNGHILAMVNGVPSFVATTTAGTGLTYDGTSFNVNFSGISQSKWATTTTDSLAITPNTALTVGIGTTTPKWALTISSSTKPQLALTDGSLTSDIWTQRNINGNFYLATSSPSTFATSSQTRLTITQSGAVGVNTATPAAGVSLSVKAVTSNLSAFSIIATDGGNLATLFNDSAENAWFRLFDTAGNEDIRLRTAGDSYFDTGAGNGSLGVGTTTPQWSLTVSSSSRPQLTLTDGSLTSNPWNFRAINNSFYLSTSSPSTFATTSTFALSVAGDGFGTTTLRGLDIIGQATSTSNVGINLTGGCFAISGTCVSSSAAANPYQIATTSDITQSGVAYFTQTAGLTTLGSIATGTVSSANSALSVTANRYVLGGNLTLTVSTTTNSIFTGTAGQVLAYTNNGWTGVATTTFSTGLTYLNGNTTCDTASASIFGCLSTTDWSTFSNKFSTSSANFLKDWQITTNTFGQSALAPTSTQNIAVSGTGTSTFAGGLEAWRQIAAPYFHATSTTATSTFSGGLSIGTTGTGFMVTPTGRTFIGTTVPLWSNSTVEVGGMLSASDIVYAGAGHISTYHGTYGSLTSDTYFDAYNGYNALLQTRGSGYVGIGTTTPRFALTIASSTGPQLALSAGAGFAQWTQRNANGTFYLSTTTVAGTATTSTFALSVAGSGFGTTTVRGLDIIGQATSTSNVGFNLTAGCYAISGTCLSTSGTNFWTQNGDAIYNNTGNVVGIGTSTPRFALTIASSTGPQLALTDGSLTSDIWTQRNINGNFYLATSSPSTFATTTIPALAIIGSSGNVGLGIASPSVRFEVASFGTTDPIARFGTTGASHSVSTEVRNSAVSLKSFVVGGGNDFFVGTLAGDAGLSFASGKKLWIKEASGAEFVFDGANNAFGIGTTSPYWGLTVSSSTGPQLALTDGSLTSSIWTQRNINGNFYLSTSSPGTFATTTISALEIAGSGFGTTTIRGLTIIGQATSTSNVGINLTGGCFAISNTCVGSGSGVSGGAANKVAFFTSATALSNNDRFHWDDTNTRLGIGTTSPWAKLSVHAYANDTLVNNMLFAIASSTASATSTVFSVSNTGLTTIGDPGGTNQDAPIQLGLNDFAWTLGYRSSDSAFAISSSTGLSSNVAFSIAKGGFSTTTLSGLTISGSATSTSNVGFNLSGGCYAISGTCLSTSGTNYWTSLSNAIYNNTGTVVGIGTTTPRYALTIASSTGPQLALTDGSNTSNPWTFRSINGNFYLATSSPSTFATSTLAALTITSTGDTLFQGGNVGIGTTTPGASLDVSGNSSGNYEALRLLNISNGGSATTDLNFRLGTTNSAKAFVRSGYDGSFYLALGAGSTATEILRAKNGLIGIATTSPRYALTIASSTGPQLALVDGSLTSDHWTFRNINNNFYLATSSPGTFATSTGTALIIDTNGNVGVASSTPAARLAVGGGGYFTGSLGVGIAAPADFVHLYGGTSAYPGVKFSGNNGSVNSFIKGYLDGASFGVQVQNGSNGALATFDNAKLAVGIGTTTPRQLLTISTSTAPQLMLTDASLTSNPWTFRAINNVLYISTSSPSTFATTSTFALSVAGDGFGTTTLRGLSIIGQATSTSNVGVNLSGGCFAINGSCVAGATSITGSGVANRLTIWNSTNELTYNDRLNFDTSSGRFGIGSTTPYARLSLHAFANDSIVNNTLFAIASSTASATTTLFSVSNTGVTTIGDQSTTDDLDAPVQVGQDWNAWTFGYASSSKSFRIASSSLDLSSNVALSIAKGGFSTTTLSGLTIAGSATSTSNVGYNITTGCYAIGGTCLSTSGTNFFTQSGDSIYNSTGNKVGIGTSTPRFALTIASSTGPQLALTDGSLTSAQWTFRNINGNLYIASSSASTFATTTVAAISISGSGFGTTTIRGLDIVGQATTTSNVGINLSGGCFAINNTCVGGGSGVSGGAANKVAFFTDATTLSNNTLFHFDNTNTLLGIGTSTPRWSLTVASSTGPQLALTDGSLTQNPWTFRSINGNFYLATSSPGTFATSTLAALTIDSTGRILLQGGDVGIGTSTPRWALQVASTTPYFALTDTNAPTDSKHVLLSNVDGIFRIGTSTDNFTSTSTALQLDPRGPAVFGIGTTSPWRTLSVVGGVAFNGLTTSATGNAVCITTGKDITDANVGSCTPSSARFKENIQTLTAGSALSTLDMLRVVSFDYKPDYASGENPASVGLIAEEVALVDTRLVDYGYDGTPFTLHFERITGLTVQAIQELNLNLLTVASTTASSTPQSQSFAMSFFSNLFTRIIAWMGDAANGVGDFFAGTVHTKQICVGENGSETCITKAQLDSLIAGAGSSNNQPPPPTSDVPGTSDVHDTEAPIISMYGNNPAEVAVGTSYADLGASVSDNVDSNLGIGITVDGVEATSVVIDTSAPGEHTIIYSATDTAGNTGSATRTVSVADPAPLAVEPPPELIPEP